MTSRTSKAGSTLAGRRLRRLDVEECLRLLDTRYVGRIGFVLDGQPMVLPMNYVLHEGTVVFRTTYGTVLDVLAGGAPVAFEVDDLDLEYHEGWSVVVQGFTEEISDPEELAGARQLPLRPWAPGARDHYVRVMSRSITGRSIE